MVNIKDLKIVAGNIVKNTKDLTIPAKQQLLNFIKEASEHQIMVLLLDGEIMKVEDPQCKKIIEDRFKYSDLSKLLNNKEKES